MGPDDQFGTLNLTTRAKRMQAADAPEPFVVNVQVMGNFARDTLEIDYHGTTHTHIDAFCHFSYEGKHFNGFDVEENISAKGSCS